MAIFRENSTKCVMLIFLFLLWYAPAFAQTQSSEKIWQETVSAAKQEGKVVWYTSLAGDSYKAIARAFEAKYSGLRLETYRAGGTELVPRMIEEARARPDLRRAGDH